MTESVLVQRSLSRWKSRSVVTGLAGSTQGSQSRMSGLKACLVLAEICSKFMVTFII